MSVEEIKKLAESGALESACGFDDINDGCGNVCDDDEISECQQKKDIRSALLAYADMVERCEKLLAKHNRRDEQGRTGYCDSCICGIVNDILGTAKMEARCANE